MVLILDGNWGIGAHAISVILYVRSDQEQSQFRFFSTERPISFISAQHVQSYNLIQVPCIRHWTNIFLHPQSKSSLKNNHGWNIIMLKINNSKTIFYVKQNHFYLNYNIGLKVWADSSRYTRQAVMTNYCTACQRILVPFSKQARNIQMDRSS